MARHFIPDMKTHRSGFLAKRRESAGFPDAGAACHGLYAQHDFMTLQQLVKGLGRFAAGGAAFVFRGGLSGGEGMRAEALHNVAQLVEIGVNTAFMATPLRQSRGLEKQCSARCRMGKRPSL